MAFTLTAHDLALAEVVQIIGNSRLTEDGETGVIVFIPGATVGPESMIEFPAVEIANANDEIANAETEADHVQAS